VEASVTELPALQPADPERVGGYRLLGRLGSGGQGTVFLGESGSGERVAVKLLKSVQDDAARARFVRELAVAKQVSSFCTARILDADVAGDQPYIVSEFIDGPTLHALVEAEGPRSAGALERLAISTATALTAIHQAGVVHRDFKPSNVVLGVDGPRVIDFGIAKALDATSATVSQVIGTPAYMAPEQLAGNAVGAAADVFAWAVTMIFAATGKPAFGEDSVPAVIQRILHRDPDLTVLNGPLRDVVSAALTKDPRQRPTAQQILLHLLGGSPSSPAPADVLIKQAQPPAALTAEAPQPGPPLRGLQEPGLQEPGLREPAPRGSDGADSTQAGGRRQTPMLLLIAGALLAVGLIAATAAIVGLTTTSGNKAGRADPAATVTQTVSASPSTRVITSPATAPSAGAAALPARSPAQTPSMDGLGVPAAFDGTWTGTATNQSGVSFPVTVTMRTGDTTAQVSYAPPAHCTTDADLISGSPQQITLEIAAGAGCTPGTATATLSGNELRWSFTSTSGRYSIQAGLTHS
jgi:hypothetical protein